MKINFLIAIPFLLFISCNSGDNNIGAEKEQNHNQQFEEFENTFIEKLWEVYPEWATSQGYHKYDSLITIPTDNERKKQVAFATAQLSNLNNFETSQLSVANKTDYYLIADQLKKIQWRIDSEKVYQWNPAEYNVCGGTSEILAGKYDLLDNRLKSIYLRMASIPAYYEAAQQYIQHPTIEHTELAIAQNAGGVTVFEKDFIDSVKASSLAPALKEKMIERSVQTAKAVHSYVNWLKQLKHEKPRSFRLGKDLYEAKFRYEIQSAYTAEQIYNKAVDHKKELHAKMYKMAISLWPKYFPGKTLPDDNLKLIRQVIDKLSLQHTTPDSFQVAIAQQLPELTAFIKQKNLIYIDPSKPLVVRKEPAYMAGVAGASVSSPGPYDKNADTYYNVGTMQGWPKEKAESYLREYNRYTMQILNIHEAIPGHYTQLVYSNQSPSLIKAILGNGAMVEGWAVYTELMMLEAGYGNNTSEMWLMYYKWNLRTVCNTILDYSVHVKGMDKATAMQLLTDEAFQQQTEAENKWRRVSLSQVQLCSYFTGFYEIYNLRETYKQQLGDKFNLKQFHEKFLSYGSAPVKYIKELMLAELKEKQN